MLTSTELSSELGYGYFSSPELADVDVLEATTTNLFLLDQFLRWDFSIL